MPYPNWPQYSPGPVPERWWPLWMDPYDPTFMPAWLNFSFAFDETGEPRQVLEPMFNSDSWIGGGLSGSIWDAFTVSTKPRLGQREEASRSLGFPLRWGLSRGVKMKSNGGRPYHPT